MNKKIMVLDDDEQIRKSLLKLLRVEGYEVILAEEGVEALDKLERQGVDLLLLDLNLPNKSGWDVFERVTSTNPLLPIIIITGREKQSELAVAAGVGALMQKPLDVPLLLKTIAELLIESPQQRLKRLVGVEQSTRCFQPVSTASTANSRKRKQARVAPHI
ncbi:MAG TPA: response regulator [Verrucomicrobiae bacterium]|nr:response regulator [Verrucomicrobiae bacterium]